VTHKEAAMTKQEEAAEKCVMKVLQDLNSRNGIGSAWRIIDPQVRAEIVSRWKFDITEALKEYIK
jgi:hypothetical protein